MSEPQPSFALRPLEIKHIFDFSIRLLRSGFAPMFGAMAMVQLPLAILTLPLGMQFLTALTDMQTKMNTTGQLPDASYFNKYLDLGMYALVMAVVALAYQLLVTPLGSLTCARLAATRLMGEPCTFGEAFAHARKRYWATQVALAIFLLPLLLLSVVILAFVLVFQRSGNQTGTGIVAVVGIMLITLGCFAMLLVFCRLFMAINGVLQASEEPEGQGMVQQGLWLLRRAYELTADHFWRMLGFLIFLQIIVNVISRGLAQGLQFLLAFFSAMSQHDTKAILNSLSTPSTWELGLTLTIAGLIGLIFPPYWQCFKTLLYYDMRCRKEAFDLLRLLKLPGGDIDR